MTRVPGTVIKRRRPRLPHFTDVMVPFAYSPDLLTGKLIYPLNLPRDCDEIEFHIPRDDFITITTPFDGTTPKLLPHLNGGDLNAFGYADGAGGEGDLRSMVMWFTGARQLLLALSSETDALVDPGSTRGAGEMRFSIVVYR